MKTTMKCHEDHNLLSSSHHHMLDRQMLKMTQMNTNTFQSYVQTHSLWKLSHVDKLHDSDLVFCSLLESPPVGLQFLQLLVWGRCFLEQAPTTTTQRHSEENWSGLHLNEVTASTVWTCSHSFYHLFCQQFLKDYVWFLSFLPKVCQAEEWMFLVLNCGNFYPLFILEPKSGICLEGWT